MHGNNISSILDSPIVQWISESDKLSDNAGRPDLLGFENFYRVFPGTQYSTIDASGMAPLCRPLPSAILFSVSPLEESHVHLGETKKSDFVVSISSDFPKADAQDSIARGRFATRNRHSNLKHHY